jgi:predicted nucleic acid-binding protein
LTVGVDATFLLHLFAPAGTVGVVLDANGQPVTMPKERVQGLVAELEKTGATIIVGTPALSEMMVHAGVQAGQAWLQIMNASKAFKVVPFDAKSAIEVALMAGHAVKGQGGKTATVETYAKLKYDRQIVAIARTEGATVFYTDDDRQGNIAKRLGLVVRGLADCPIPTTAAQNQINFGAPHGQDTET